MMKTIGITGGVGAGKSEILKYIGEKYNCRIIISDIVAYELESPGHECYNNIVALLGSDICDENGFIIKKAMAARIFADKELLEGVNAIIHPAVKKYILDEISEERERGIVDYCIVEAALLIEEGYEKILDELWYIRVDEEVRRSRLKSSRGYSDEKIDSIMRSQLSDEEYRRHCRAVIDNSTDLEETYKQIDVLFGGTNELS